MESAIKCKDVSRQQAGFQALLILSEELKEDVAKKKGGIFCYI